MAAFDELKSSAVTEEGQRLLAGAEQAAARWRDADNRALLLLKAGKRVEAADLHDAEIVPRFHELGNAIAGYREYRGQKLEQINQRAEAYLARTSFLLIGFSLAFIMASVV